MAVTTAGIDKAEITQCVEVDGRFEKPLAWKFVKFDDASEVDRYVMPADNGLHLFGAEPYRVTKEVMRNRGFPHEADRVYSLGDLAKPGPIAVHFFGQRY